MIRSGILLVMAVAANAEILVPTNWLAAHLTDSNVVLLHVGSQKDYDAGHIPGARLLTLGDISVTGDRGLRLQLPPADALVAALEKLGITDQSRVVIYAGNDSVQSATRAWFTFDYLGLADRTSLLNGGLAQWRSEGRAVSTEATPAAKAGKLNVRPRPELVVDAAYLQGNREKFTILDARTTEFYSGANAGRMPRAGHIPGARSTPFHTFLEENGRFKSPEALRAALGAGKDIVTYCHIGQQATVPYFVARYLQLEPKLYDGSFQDWSMRTELPVEPATK